MNICEKTGKMNVWHTGILHVYEEYGTASINIVDSDLHIYLKFETKSNVPAGRINFNGNGKTMTITCYNFFSALREGPSKPVRIGTYDGKELFIDLSVFTYGEKFRLVHYSLLYGTEL